MNADILTCKKSIQGAIPDITGWFQLEWVFWPGKPATEALCELHWKELHEGETKIS